MNHENAEMAPNTGTSAKTTAGTAETRNAVTIRDEESGEKEVMTHGRFRVSDR